MPRYDIVCSNGHETFDIIKGVNDPYPPCKECGSQTERLWTHSGGIIGDDIPGGIEIRHGLVNEDGSPRRFYSKTEMRKEADRLGLTMKGDTPRPYYRRKEI